MKKGILLILLIAALVILSLLIFKTVDQKGSDLIKRIYSEEPDVSTKPVMGRLPVLVFFGNSQNDPDASDCATTYSTPRLILASADKYLATLEELLGGPTEKEQEQGFFSSINPGIQIPSVNFLGGTVTVNFQSDLETAVGGSCRVTAIRSQIENTLKQFPEVKEVVISVDGRVADVLQP